MINYLRFIFFFRYFDDLRAVVVYQSSDITTKSLVKELLQHLQHRTYHPSMTLILEEISDNTFNFLEWKFSLTNGSLKSQWHSKNFQSLQESGKLKWSSSQDYFSYSGNKNKIIRAATISGRLTTSQIGILFYGHWYYQGFWLSNLQIICMLLWKKGIVFAGFLNKY